MISDEQIAILREIDDSVAFGDEREGLVNQLIVAGYVEKNGDLYELTASGEKVLLDNGAGLITK